MSSISRSYGAHVADRGEKTATLSFEVRLGERAAGLSFETGEQGTTRLYFQEAATITKIRGIVTKALAATDAGTITPKDSGGNTMTGGTLTFAAGAALGNEQTGTPSANNTVAAGSFIDLVSAKTTAGGKLYVTVEYRLQDGEDGTVKLYFQDRVKILKTRAIATKKIGPTDSATLTFKNNAGATMTGGTLTFAAGAVQGTEQTGTPTANNVIEPGQCVQIAPAKTTPGGRAEASVEWVLYPGP